MEAFCLMEALYLRIVELHQVYHRWERRDQTPRSAEPRQDRSDSGEQVRRRASRRAPPRRPLIPRAPSSSARRVSRREPLELCHIPVRRTLDCRRALQYIIGQRDI